MTATTVIGLGKGIGLVIAWIDETLRQHYNPKREQSYGAAQLSSIPIIFFDKEFIRDLK
jgi:hypothetical protein